ncbi:putative gustatory receptor 92a [Drosophila subpulchrella]|uniref:putative gustatory receptor 92a n=1 Tax=Drosophila subpulchrella TaxID=1486046 RepID=UPI0018A19C0A|nr:putative gustatory receptor 92a [Drosophila subpulchrella]
MYRIFHLMSVPKLNALILRYIFRYAQLIGVIFFCLRKSEDGERVSNCKWIKWLGITHRLVTFGIFIYSYYLAIIITSQPAAKILHFFRLLLSIPIVAFILGYQTLRGAEIIELFNQFLQLFRQVRNLFKPKPIGFGGGRELILILLNLICLFHELTYIWVAEKHFHWHFWIYWWCDVYVVTGTNMFIHLNCMAYLSVGVLYSEVNKYVRTHLGTQLQKLNTTTGENEIRRAYNRLEKCIHLYREIYNISTTFQRLFVLPLFLAMINKVLLITTLSFRMILDLEYSSCIFWLLVGKHILDYLLLTISVQGALNQFRIIRRPNLEIGEAGKLRNFQRTLEIFFTHLNICQFRVSILGLCEITNELFLKFLSALTCWLAFIAQYRMQIRNVYQNT